MATEIVTVLDQVFLYRKQSELAMENNKTRVACILQINDSDLKVTEGNV